MTYLNVSLKANLDTLQKLRSLYETSNVDLELCLCFSII